MLLKCIHVMELTDLGKMKYVPTVNATMNAAEMDKPMVRSANVVTAVRTGPDKPHRVMTMNKVLFSTKLPLSNKHPGQSFTIPGSAALRILSGIQPASVGKNGASERNMATQYSAWKCPASARGPT